MNSKTDIGRRIARYRLKKGLTQSELAELAGVENNAISKIECGNSMPECQTLINICTALEITVNEILIPESTVSSENILVSIKDGDPARKKLVQDFVEVANQTEFKN